MSTGVSALILWINLPVSISAPLDFWADIVLSVSFINVGINRSAIVIIIASSWTGNPIFNNGLNNDSIAQDIISPRNFNVNSILSLEEDENIKKINKTEKDIKINKLNNNEEEKKMEEKIQKIDKDILDLKTKLKKIYSK